MYSQAGNHLNYFIPNIPLATTTAGVMREIDIGASSGDHGEYICVKPCIIKRCQFMMVGELAGGTSAAPTVIFTKRPTPLSATGETVAATLTIPNATAVGVTVYKDIELTMDVGDSIELSWTVGTGTPTGIGLASMVCFDHEEAAGNNTDMLESA